MGFHFLVRWPKCTPDSNNSLKFVLDIFKNCLRSLIYYHFVVYIHREHISISEAKKLGIPTFAIVDTNSDPNLVDFCIPGNDDASRSIEKIVSLVTDAIQEGLSERNSEKEAAASAKVEANASAEEKVEESAEKK